MHCFVLDAEKLSRFLSKDEAKTLSSVCNVPRDKANIENNLGNQEIITTFATSDRERLSNSADCNVHRALFPVRVMMLFLSLKADDVANRRKAAVDLLSEHSITQHAHYNHRSFWLGGTRCQGQTRPRSRPLARP